MMVTKCSDATKNNTALFVKNKLNHLQMCTAGTVDAVTVADSVWGGWQWLSDWAAPL